MLILTDDVTITFVNCVHYLECILKEVIRTNMSVYFFRVIRDQLLAGDFATTMKLLQVLKNTNK